MPRLSYAFKKWCKTPSYLAFRFAKRRLINNREENGQLKLITMSRWSDFRFLLRIAGIDFWLAELLISLTFSSDTLRPRRRVEAIAERTNLKELFRKFHQIWCEKKIERWRVLHSNFESRWVVQSCPIWKTTFEFPSANLGPINCRHRYLWYCVDILKSGVDFNEYFGLFSIRNC
jgi:hypothetical protein